MAEYLDEWKLNYLIFLKSKMKRTLKLWYYFFKNRFSNATILDKESKIVVSLTSHSKRIFRAFAAIESIGAGDTRPGRIILFLDYNFEGKELPLSIKRLCKRGLEIFYCEDVGPHTKYYPYLLSQIKFSTPLVTADDDILYPEFWLARLIRAWNANPNDINCFRARKIKFTEAGFAPYEQWKICTNDQASLSHFATGVSGVIYPPAFLELLKQAGDAFRDCCPKADDVWLHVIAIRTGFKVRQIESYGHHFLTVPRSSRTALVRTNIDNGQNDIQIIKSYSIQDIYSIKNP